MDTQQPWLGSPSRCHHGHARNTVTQLRHHRIRPWITVLFDLNLDAASSRQPPPPCAGSVSATAVTELHAWPVRCYLELVSADNPDTNPLGGPEPPMTTLPMNLGCR